MRKINPFKPDILKLAKECFNLFILKLNPEEGSLPGPKRREDLKAIDASLLTVESEPNFYHTNSSRNRFE